MFNDLDIFRNGGRINGLDLFSGIGGISLALRDYVRTVAYCEVDAYCQSVILSRMADGDLCLAPIWDDVTTLSTEQWQQSSAIDIICGGFPCQGFSVAGVGKGLADERSGLFYEIVRLCREISPKWIFLENVPAITSRGGRDVVRELASLGYDCRWCVISAASVGALHRRERWFLLANAKRSRLEGHGAPGQSQISESRNEGVKHDGNANGQPSEQANPTAQPIESEGGTWRGSSGQCWPFESREHWQAIVSSMGKCSHGVSDHVARLKCLGNSVVPQQVKEAFEILMGLK